MKRLHFISIALLVSASFFGCKEKPVETPKSSLVEYIRATKDETETIVKILMAQVDAWNKGDIEGYMQGYWQDTGLTFIGKNGITKGYDSTLARYKRSYPDAKAMGKLTSTIISMDMMGNEAYYVTGKWELARMAGNLSGYYTLLLKKENGEWVIVSDHSS